MSLKVIRDDITKVQADVIVNTANPAPTYSYGVDTAIYHSAGKEKLLKEREKIGIIAEGDIAVTEAFDLKAKYIIHAVGCFYVDGNHREKEVLESCYDKSLAKAIELGCQSIAFPLMGTGSYGFPQNDALAIALNCINRFLIHHDIKVLLVVFGNYAVSIANKIFVDIDQYIDDHYVTEANKAEYGGEYHNNYNAQSKSVVSPIKTGLELVQEALDKKSHKSFAFILNDFVTNSGMKPSDVYKNAYVSKQTYSKIMSENHIPNKKSILALCISLKLNLKEATLLLESGGYSFSDYSKLDVAVKCFIENKIYDMEYIDSILYDKNIETFNKEN